MYNMVVKLEDNNIVHYYYSCGKQINATYYKQTSKYFVEEDNLKVSNTKAQTTFKLLSNIYKNKDD